MKMQLEQRRQAMLLVGAAPTISQWSTILLATKVRLILDTWRQISENIKVLKRSISMMAKNFLRLQIVGVFSTSLLH